MKKFTFVIFTLIAGLLSAQSLSDRSIPSDFPSKTTVLNDLTSDSTVKRLLDDKNLSLRDTYKTYVIDVDAQRVDVEPSNPFNFCTYKITFDFYTRNRIERVTIAASYTRRVSGKNARPWEYKGYEPRLSTFDKIQIIQDDTRRDDRKDTSRDDDRVSADSNNRSDSRSSSNERVSANSSSNSRMSDRDLQDLVEEAVKKDAKDLFDDSRQVKVLGITIPRDANYTEKGDICNFYAEIKYEYKKQIYVQRVYIEARRLGSRDSFKYSSSKTVGRATRA